MSDFASGRADGRRQAGRGARRRQKSGTPRSGAAVMGKVKAPPAFPAPQGRNLLKKRHLKRLPLAFPPLGGWGGIFRPRVFFSSNWRAASVRRRERRRFAVLPRQILQGFFKFWRGKMVRRRQANEPVAILKRSAATSKIQAKRPPPIWWEKFAFPFPAGHLVSRN